MYAAEVVANRGFACMNARKPNWEMRYGSF